MALCALTMALAGWVLATPTPGDLASYFSPESFTKTVKCPEYADGSMTVVDDFTAEWYANVWRAADEPSLYRQTHQTTAPGLRTYRFTWLPTFHSPVTVRLEERAPGRFWMTAKRLSVAGGYDPGHLTDKVERLLTPDETQPILTLLKKTRVTSAEPAICDSGADGARWIFEGIESGKLHYINRWSPRTGPVHDIGLAFLDLTSWSHAPAF